MKGPTLRLFLCRTRTARREHDEHAGHPVRGRIRDGARRYRRGVIAALSAVITCVVLIRGSDEIGIPIAGWIVGTILSLAAAFVELTPTVVAAAAGAVLVVVALVVLGGRRSHSRRLHTR